jgi:NAD-dependent deacetylase
MPTVEDAAALIRNARYLAVLTGAGISAESGIPTFREALTGLWASYDPETLATPGGFQRQPRLVWDWYAERRARVKEARPNPGHLALAELERRVPRFALFTQNVDGLHQEAGSQSVTELHGNIRRVRCARAGHVVESWEDDGVTPPACPICGDLLRPDVVWFGEMLPEGALESAWEAVGECDLFLSVGTSNLVEPAASLPWQAHRRGVPVLVVNTTDEGQHHGAGIHHLAGKAGEVLPALLEAMGPRRD